MSYETDKAALAIAKLIEKLMSDGITMQVQEYTATSMPLTISIKIGK